MEGNIIEGGGKEYHRGRWEGISEREVGGNIRERGGREYHRGRLEGILQR